MDKVTVVKYSYETEKFEILVKPDPAFDYKLGKISEISKILVSDEIYTDSGKGKRASSELLLKVFKTDDSTQIAEIMMKKGELNLTTEQRKKRVKDMRLSIIHKISSTAIDPKSKMPHPPSRIETALDECRYSIDPFLSIDRQVNDAIKLMRPLIPLKFATARLAFRIPGVEYGSVQSILRELMTKEEWLPNGDWACVVEVPAGSKIDLMGDIAKRSKGSQVKIIDEGS